ncbi:MAG: hypothetical protein HGA24_12440, partial [Candidatus Aminicenantes bacterium]|nr:hypothetical protein [Candidatus Aminicenantes bacterium]
CRPGFAVQDFGEWRSVYSAAPNLPAPVLRAVARFAGVHIYSDAGDVLYANKSFLGIHTLAGGERTIRLPRRAPGIADLVAGQVIARDVAEFRAVLEPRSTALYCTAFLPGE